MSEIITVGIDLAKNVFQGACRKPCSRLRLPRERWHFHALLTF